MSQFTESKDNGESVLTTSKRENATIAPRLCAKGLDVDGFPSLHVMVRGAVDNKGIAWVTACLGAQQVARQSRLLGAQNEDFHVRASSPVPSRAVETLSGHIMSVVHLESMAQPS